MSPLSQVYVKGGKWDHTECIDPSSPVTFCNTFGVLSARFIFKMVELSNNIIPK